MFLQNLRSHWEKVFLFDELSVVVGVVGGQVTTRDSLGHNRRLCLISQCCCVCDLHLSFLLKVQVDNLSLFPRTHPPSLPHPGHLITGHLFFSILEAAAYKNTY